MSRARSSRTSPSQDLIAQIMEQAGEPASAEHEKYVGEIVSSVIGLARDETSIADLKLINAALKEMRHAFRVFAPYQDTLKVSTFGSARTPPGAPAYVQARKFAERICREGFMVLTGAGGGIMRACQEGAGPGRSFGVNIRLPLEQTPNEFIAGDKKLINFKYFFTRKLIFVKEADAIVLFPGGYGTYDEGFEALTLAQTGKSRPMPIVFVDAPGGRYWKTWQRYLEDHVLRQGLISPEDTALFRVTDDADEAVAEIVGFYRVYNSSRYVAERFVIRLNAPLPASLMADLNGGFSDILYDGQFELGDALPEECGEPAIAQLPRLIFKFNRQSFGRLRMLIDHINREGPAVSGRVPAVRTEDEAGVV